MTTNQTIDGVRRELLEALVQIHPSDTRYRFAKEELRALLEPADHVHEWDINAEGTATVCYCGARSSDEPAAQPHGEPVAYADPQAFDNFKNLAWRGGSYAKEWMWAKPAPGLIPLYTEQPAPVSSTSDKYKAELYDEVWQKARDMGFGNVTDALIKLEKQPALVASVIDDNVEFEKWWMSTQILRKQKIQIAQEAWFARANLSK